MTILIDVNIKLHYVVAMIMGLGKDYVNISMSYPSPLSVLDLLDDLAEQIGEPFVKKVYNPTTKVVNSGLSVIINGNLSDLRKLDDIVITGNSNVFIFPVYAGG